MGIGGGQGGCGDNRRGLGIFGEGAAHDGAGHKRILRGCGEQVRGHGTSLGIFRGDTRGYWGLMGTLRGGAVATLGGS